MAGHRWLNTIDDQGIVTNCDRYDTIERVVPRIFPPIEKYTLSTYPPPCLPSSLCREDPQGIYRLRLCVAKSLFWGEGSISLSLFREVQLYSSEGEEIGDTATGLCIKSILFCEDNTGGRGREI